MNNPNFPPLRPLVPYRIPEEDRKRETATIDAARQEAIKWLRSKGITEPRFKK